MNPLECYRTYIAIKNHFTQRKYDFHKYNGHVKASLQSFYKRKDRFWFEKMSRTKTEEEIKNFFVANFALSPDPQTLWIGEIIKNGESNYLKWKKRIESLTYMFKDQCDIIFADGDLSSFEVKGTRHPKIVKLYLSNKVSLETLIILDKILHFTKIYDKKLVDPVWEFTSMKIKKYSPFVYVDTKKYKGIVKEFVE